MFVHTSLWPFFSCLCNALCRLNDMENTNNKLLQALRKSGAEKIFEAYQWLQQHKHELNKEVYGPVLLEVHFKNMAVLFVMTIIFAYSCVIFWDCKCRLMFPIRCMLTTWKAMSPIISGRYFQVLSFPIFFLKFSIYACMWIIYY